MSPRHLAVGCLAAISLSALAGSVASATPPSSPPPAPAAPPVEGTLEGRTRASNDKIQLRTKDDATVRSFTLVYPPGSFSGWHEHPGIVVAVVESGSVIRRLVDCSPPETFSRGEAFTEVEGHFVSNPSATEPAVLRITQIYPADRATPPRDELPDPGC